ncbi:hypothetical protein BJF95_06320 [Rhizobium oryziradicis]|uniref:Uncharacterized protein n=1 Tax=Rhizobium oryziradicis TaxID=1867956 RepID=A0A1Q8ZQ36_9HYPH|nr:hypothetical protein BJF95_06320 [Rhizobium oryziradicis]
MRDVYAKLPDILHAILLSMEKDAIDNNLRCIQPDNDDIASSTRDGLDLVRTFSQIRDPIMREIVIEFVKKIAKK